MKWCRADTVIVDTVIVDTVIVDTVITVMEQTTTNVTHRGQVAAKEVVAIAVTVVHEAPSQ